MKITHNDGSVTDTRYMPDRKAEILEENAKIIKKLLKKDIPFLLFTYNADDNCFGGGQHFKKSDRIIKQFLARVDQWVRPLGFKLERINPDE